MNKIEYINSEEIEFSSQLNEIPDRQAVVENEFESIMGLC